MYKLTRKWTSLAILMLTLFINACAAESGKPNLTNTKHNTERKLMAGELIVNAVKDAEMLGVEMFADGMEKPFYRKARSTYKNTDKMSFPLPRIPQEVRVIWRGQDRGWDKVNRVWNDGSIAGDYTIPVASRIPTSVFEEIERNGGALRIKFRLKPDGVMLGWDIMREGKGKYTFDYEMAGGDFREARIYNGKVDRKGWYIDKNGQKIEMDY